jgi:hypothetical protein
MARKTKQLELKLHRNVTMLNQDVREGLVRALAEMLLGFADTEMNDSKMEVRDEVTEIDK